MPIIDARGLACPEPVIKAKRGLKESPEGVEILVDNNTAVENVKRFAGGKGYQAEVAEENGDFRICITK